MDISFFLNNLQQPLTESIIGNTALSLIIVLLGIFDFIYGFVEFLEKDGSVKRLLKAVALTAVTIALCLFVKLVFALLIIVIAVFLMILFSAWKRIRKENDQARITMGAEGVDLPSELGITASVEYKRATECIKDKRPREAIEYLLECRGKIVGQPKFFITYADAFMMLGNFSGALTKLNDIPSKRLNKKKTFINVMVRKAYCHHGLHEYAKELECYNAMLAKNIQPEINYFLRAQVKQRILEVCPYLASAEQAIANISGSEQTFIESIFEDLDKAQHYSKQGGELDEGKILSCKGAVYILGQDFQNGWELLTEARKNDEFYPNTYTYLGIYYHHKKNFTQAIEMLEKAISCEKKAGAAPDVARSRLAKAISCEKKAGAASDVALYYLAQIYYERKLYDRAIHCAAQSLSIFPYRNECFRIQGDSYNAKVMHTEAIECYTNAIKLKPRAEYYASRARCFYNRRGESKDAYHDMKEAIKLNDCAEYQLSALLYAANLDKKKNIHKDKEELDTLLAPYQNDPANFVNLGIIYSDYQYFDESQHYYRKAIERTPKNGTAHFDLALLLQKTNRIEEAVDELQTAIKLEPMKVKYYRVLANCYRDLNDPLNEMQTRKSLDEVCRRHCNVNKNSGDAVYRIKKYQAAIDYYQAALSYWLCAEVLNNLACAYFAQERYESCIECLEKAILQDKGYFLAYFNLGNCQLRMSKTRGGLAGMKEAAKKNFETAFSLNAKFEQASLMLKSMNAKNIEMIIDKSEC